MVLSLHQNRNQTVINSGQQINTGEEEKWEVKTCPKFSVVRDLLYSSTHASGASVHRSNPGLFSEEETETETINSLSASPAQDRRTPKIRYRASSPVTSYPSFITLSLSEMIANDLICLKELSQCPKP